MNPSNNPFREIIFSFRFFLSEKKKEEEVLELLEVVVEEENEEEGEKWEGERKASIWNEEEEEEEEDNEKGLRQETRKTKIVKRKIGYNRIVGLYRFLSLWSLEFSSSFSTKKEEEAFLFPDLLCISSWGILSLSLSQAK